MANLLPGLVARIGRRRADGGAIGRLVCYGREIVQPGDRDRGAPCAFWRQLGPRDPVAALLLAKSMCSAGSSMPLFQCQYLVV